VIYIEATISPMSSLLRCDHCGKLIRWPEEIRAYSESLGGRIERIEHTNHTPRKGAERAEP